MAAQCTKCRSGERRRRRYGPEDGHHGRVPRCWGPGSGTAATATCAGFKSYSTVPGGIAAWGGNARLHRRREDSDGTKQAWGSGETWARLRIFLLFFSGKRTRRLIGRHHDVASGKASMFPSSGFFRCHGPFAAGIVRSVSRQIGASREACGAKKRPAEDDSAWGRRWRTEAGFFPTRASARVALDLPISVIISHGVLYPSSSLFLIRFPRMSGLGAEPLRLRAAKHVRRPKAIFSSAGFLFFQSPSFPSLPARSMRHLFSHV